MFENRTVCWRVVSHSGLRAHGAVTTWSAETRLARRVGEKVRPKTRLPHSQGVFHAACRDTFDENEDPLFGQGGTGSSRWLLPGWFEAVEGSEA